MFKFSRVPLALVCAFLAVACSKPGATDAKATDSGADASAPADLSSDSQKFSYAVGYDIGHNLSQPQIKDSIDLKALEKGLEESTSGTASRLTDKEREEIKTAISKKIQEKQVAERAAMAEKNKADGEKFLADNGQKPGVKTTASGLEYEVITEGKGDHPKASDKVKVNYKGTLLDGTVFDSSYDRGQPVSFPLANVVPGWTEGVQLMTVGSKYKFYLPSKLAYGERGAMPKIQPNSTLIFEVELLAIEPPAPAPAAAPAAPAAPQNKLVPKTNK
jgi:FKBP-type peptidyl-prolyl cis-trans isomerase